MRGDVLLTGIGSLPHQDVERAVELVFKYTGSVPFWPQLPKRDFREGMLMQFSEGLCFLKPTQQGLIYEEDLQKKLEDFYAHIIEEDIDYFKITKDFALGLYRFYERLKGISLKEVSFIKTQITGPFSFTAGIKTPDGSLLLKDKVIQEAITKGLIYKAVWQISFFLEFRKRLILFFDEPYLSCFGSAYTPINREEIVGTLTEVFKEVKELSYKLLGIKEEELLLGIHCCGNTDWSIFLENPELDILSFDAFGFGDRLLLYPELIKEFLKRKKILCWGIVPTLEFTESMDEDFILKRFRVLLDSFVKKGIDRDLILDKLILTPSCGLGNVEERRADEILALLWKVYKFLFDKKVQYL